MEVAIHITAARRTVGSSMESPVSYTNGISHPLDKCSKFPVRSIDSSRLYPNPHPEQWLRNLFPSYAPELPEYMKISP